MLCQCSKKSNSDDNGNNGNWFFDQQKIKDFKRKSDMLYHLGNENVSCFYLYKAWSFVDLLPYSLQWTQCYATLIKEYCIHKVQR